MSRSFLPSLTALALLAACTVGPDYEGPPDAAPIASHAASFNRAAVADAVATPPPARWWDALGDPLLIRLTDTALRNSATVERDAARLRNARAMIAERRAGLFPSGGAQALAVRTQIPIGDASALVGGGGPAAAGGARPSSYTTNLFDAGFDATWEIDLFGGTRRAIESARATAGAQEATLADAQVQLAADLAQAYVNLRDAQHRVDLLQRSTEIEQRMLDLTRQRRDLGTASDTDAARLEAQLQQTAAEVPTAQSEIDQYLDQIATLVGVEPGALDRELSAPASLPMPPGTVAVGDPAAMLRRRPDIRQAERQLAASTAEIGRAVAQYFPSVTLLGTVGFSSTQAAGLFNGSNLTYLGGPSLTWNVLDFPRISARVDEAKASRDAAIAQYRETVLSALQDANTSLSRYGHQRENTVRLAAAAAVADRAAVLNRQREQEGTASLIDRLDVERQRLQTEQRLVDAQAMVTKDYVSLQKALGLGWDVPTEDTASTVQR